MKYFPLFALLSVIPVVACAKVPDKPAPPSAQSAQLPAAQLGVFEGTGRACSGRLTITPKTLAWKTPFSPCSASAYSLVENRRTTNAQQWAYAVKTPSKRCFYKVVMLEQVAQKTKSEFEWNVSGFPSIEAYRADSNTDRLNCYLIRVK